MPKYQGKEVQVTDIQQGEQGFDPNKPMVKITHDDGRTETVAKDQVK